MQIRRILLAAFALALQTLLVHAENATRKVGDAEFNFAVPREYCVLDENNYRDSLFISVVKSLLQGASNKLILLTVDCDRLKTWRDGDNSNILKYAMYYIPSALENLTLPGESQSLRKGLCQDMRKQGDSTLDKAKEIVAQKAKEMSANFAINSTSYIGVVDEDEHGCYAALLVNVKDTNGKSIVISSIVTSTVIHSKPLFFAIYNKYDGPETTQEGVERSKAVAADLDKANP